MDTRSAQQPQPQQPFGLKRDAADRPRTPRIKWLGIVTTDDNGGTENASPRKRSAAGMSDQQRQQRRRSDGDMGMNSKSLALRLVGSASGTYRRMSVVSTTSISKAIAAPLGFDRWRAFSLSDSSSRDGHGRPRASSLNLNPTWPDPDNASKYPLDLRPPRYAVRTPTTAAAAAAAAAAAEDVFEEEPDDDDEQLQDTERLGRQDGSGLLNVPEEAVLDADASKPEYRPISSSHRQQQQQHHHHHPRPRFEKINGMNLQVDPEGVALSLWEGQKHVEWGEKPAVDRLDDFLLASRRERGEIFYMATQEDLLDRHCSEHADKPPTLASSWKLKRHLCAHKIRHVFTGHCANRGCCMDSRGKELARRAATWAH